MKRKQPTLAADSGQVSAFRPAPHRKPRGLVQRLAGRASQFLARVSGQTTEQGAAGAASPSTYEATLLVQRYDRREIVNDCNELFRDEPRCRRSIKRMAAEAARAGVTITVSQAVPEALRARAQAHCDLVQSLCNPRLKSWGRMLLVEGDLFVQAVVHQSGTLQAAKRMPAASMERCTDDADEFVDNSRAFAQVDVMTNEEIATFPLALMHHERWDHEDGERYGNPEVLAGRRMGRRLELMEEAQSVRRMTRAPLTRIWSVGSPDNPAQNWEQVNDFKKQNGFLDGKREIYDPTEVARDVFGNGLVTADTLEGDPHVHEIDDLKYSQNVYTSAALPTPAQLFGLDAESINRDVVDDLRAEWLKSVDDLAESLERVARFLVNLSLSLEGILPEAVPYDVTFSESSIETDSETAQRIVGLRSARLLSRRRAVSLLAHQTGVDDVDAELAEIDKEMAEEAQRAAAEAPKNAAPDGGKDKNGRNPEP